MKSKWNILVLLGILILIAAPAAASPPTPFLISGWVNNSHGYPVNDPDAVVTSTDEDFVVKTNVSSNYYQVMTSSYNVSAGDVLGFSVNGGAATNHEVTEGEIGAGGFEQNLAVPMQMPGDVNGDGHLTAADAAIVLQMAVRGECSEVADVSGDGVVTSLDALMILQEAGQKENLVTVETDKMVYEQGEPVNITVRNGLNYEIRIGLETGCHGTVYHVQRFDNDTWTNLTTVCGYCLMAILDDINPMSSKMYDWNQTVYADQADCGSLHQVPEGTYRIKIRYRYYNATEFSIYGEAYSDDFTISNITLIRDIKANPEAYEGKIVTIVGENVGWNCTGCGCGEGPPVSWSDWCMDDETGCIYITGSCWQNYGQFPKIEGMVKICGKYNTTFPYIDMGWTLDGVELSCRDIDKNVTTNETVNYTIIVINTENVRDTFNLTVINMDNASVAELSTDSITIDAGANGYVTLEVADETAGRYNVAVTATPQRNRNNTDALTAYTTILNVTLIRDIKVNPEAYEGKIVTIVGENLGWNCTGCGYGPPVTRSDWCIEDETGCIYVTAWCQQSHYKIEGMVKICDRNNATFPYIYCEV